MKKSWLIGGLAAGGILVFWLGGGDEPSAPGTAAKAPVPIDSYYAVGDATPTPYGPPAAAIPQWRGGSVYSAAPSGGYNFRPLSERERATSPQTAPAAFAPPGYGIPSPPVNDSGPYAPPQGALGYKFRPIDSEKRGERYTGHFPQPFDPSLSGPTWPAGPQQPGQMRSPWNGPVPGYGPDALWVYSPGRYAY